MGSEVKGLPCTLPVLMTRPAFNDIISAGINLEASQMPASGRGRLWPALGPRSPVFVAFEGSKIHSCVEGRVGPGYHHSHDLDKMNQNPSICTHRCLGTHTMDVRKQFPDRMITVGWRNPSVLSIHAQMYLQKSQPWPSSFSDKEFPKAQEL